jgi:hypothetical protein
MAPTVAYAADQSLPRAVVTTMSLGAIVGIAVGGAFLLFSLLIAVSFVLITKKHRHEKRTSEVNEDGFVDMDLKTAIRSTRPPEINLSRKLSFNTFYSLEDGVSAHDWANDNTSQNAPMTKPKRLSQRFRLSGLRDSWPLSNVPLAHLPGQSTMTQSQAAVPGYVVADSKQPKRSSLVLSRTRSISVEQEDARSNSPTKCSSPAKSHSPTNDPYAPSVTPHRPNLQRRSTSESQLSTILRSTSQRLKAVHRLSLTRTLSTLGRFPGVPPTERFPTPPGKIPTESREALVAKDYAESIGSSVYDSYFHRTPSPDKKGQKKSNQTLERREKSPNPSHESDDSLCGRNTPDLVIPAPLTSPSRHGLPGEQRHRMRISSGGLKNISSAVDKDSRASIMAAGGEDLVLSKDVFSSPPQRIYLAGDPFYSMVKSSKPGVPNTQIQGPRPQYARKATFGHEAMLERPTSFCSPLQDVSGNVQGPQKSEAPQSPIATETNPFQWSPKEAMQTRATQTSPKRSGSKQKGHKRSNVVRMSNLPRPASTVEAVPEEPEEDSPLRFRVPYNPSIRRLESMKSPSPSTSITSSNRRLGVRPPSTANFNPTFTVHEHVGRSEDNSPTLGLDQGIYSPTLSVCNYYSETPGSEDEFFSSKQTAISTSVLKSHRHARTYSVDLSRNSKELERLISFPLPKLSGSEIPILEPPQSYDGFPRPLPNIMSMMTPAPPLLTMPIPSHLTGPRAEPKREPPRPNSLEASIGMLRRMNSEVSTYSTVSSATSNDESPPSPTLPSYRSSLLSGERDSFDVNNPEERERGRSRGSKHYLSIGNLSTPPKREKKRASSWQRHGNGVEKTKRDSARVYRERRKRKNEEMETAERGDELTPVKEMSSPPPSSGGKGGVVSGLRFPTLSSAGTNGLTPPRVTPTQTQRKRSKTIEDELDLEMEKENKPQLGKVRERWSDAMPKSLSNVVRRESKLEHPAPQRETPPKWGWGLGEDGKVRIPGLGLVGNEGGVVVSGLGLAGVRLMGKGEEEQVSRPNSLGLYDQEGFLRSSPEREILEKEERARREKRAMGRLSGYVM